MIKLDIDNARFRVAPKTTRKSAGRRDAAASIKAAIVTPRGLPLVDAATYTANIRSLKAG